MSYNDYKNEVKKVFVKQNPTLSSKEIDQYFAEKATDDTIRDDYDVFKGKNIAKISPNSTAYTLSMLY